MRHRDAQDKNGPVEQFGGARSKSPAQPSPSNSVSPVMHPFAAAVHNLCSPMSIRDQADAIHYANDIIFFSLFVSLPVAWWAGNVLFSVGAVTVAGLICFALFIPNWRQRKDPDAKWVSKAKVYYYYKNLEMKRAELNVKKGFSVRKMPDMPAENESKKKN